MKRRQVRVTIIAVSLLAAPAVLAQGTVGVGNPASAPSEAPPAIPSVEPATPAAPTQRPKPPHQPPLPWTSV
jgi:hypothetical protein